MSPDDFWQAVYIAAIAAGHDNETACRMADRALDDLEELGG